MRLRFAALRFVAHYRLAGYLPACRLNTCRFCRRSYRFILLHTHGLVAFCGCTGSLVCLVLPHLRSAVLPRLVPFTACAHFTAYTCPRFCYRFCLTVRRSVVAGYRTVHRTRYVLRTVVCLPRYVTLPHLPAARLQRTASYLRHARFAVVTGSCHHYRSRIGHTVRHAVAALPRLVRFYTARIYVVHTALPRTRGLRLFLRVLADYITPGLGYHVLPRLVLVTLQVVTRFTRTQYAFWVRFADSHWLLVLVVSLVTLFRLPRYRRLPHSGLLYSTFPVTALLYRGYRLLYLLRFLRGLVTYYIYIGWFLTFIHCVYGYVTAYTGCGYTLLPHAHGCTLIPHGCVTHRTLQLRSGSAVRLLVRRAQFFTGLPLPLPVYHG